MTWNDLGVFWKHHTPMCKRATLLMFLISVILLSFSQLHVIGGTVEFNKEMLQMHDGLVCCVGNWSQAIFKLGFDAFFGCLTSCIVQFTFAMSTLNRIRFDLLVFFSWLAEQASNPKVSTMDQVIPMKKNMFSLWTLEQVTSDVTCTINRLKFVESKIARLVHPYYHPLKWEKHVLLLCYGCASASCNFWDMWPVLQVSEQGHQSIFPINQSSTSAVGVGEKCRLVLILSCV